MTDDIFNASGCLIEVTTCAGLIASIQVQMMRFCDNLYQNSDHFLYVHSKFKLA